MSRSVNAKTQSLAVSPIRIGNPVRFKDAGVLLFQSRQLLVANLLLLRLCRRFAFADASVKRGSTTAISQH